jgi:hypothetical protein
MLKRMLFLSAVVAALAVPGTASAASQSRGVVVKVDRSLVAVASTNGHVRLVHVAAARGLRVGQLISYSARKLRNGTFAGTSVRVVRALRGLQVRGLVLGRTPGGFAVSANGALLRLHAVRGMRTTAGLAAAGPRRGSSVLVFVTPARTGLNATRVRILSASAPAGAFEGQIMAIGASTLTVADDGVSLTFTVPGTIDLSTFHLGDEVLVFFSTQSDGTLAVTAIGGDETAAEADDELEIEGDVESAEDLAEASEDAAEASPAAASDDQAEASDDAAEASEDQAEATNEQGEDNNDQAEATDDQADTDEGDSGGGDD